MHLLVNVCVYWALFEDARQSGFCQTLSLVKLKLGIYFVTIGQLLLSFRLVKIVEFTNREYYESDNDLSGRKTVWGTRHLCQERQVMGRENVFVA